MNTFLLSFFSFLIKYVLYTLASTIFLFLENKA